MKKKTSYVCLAVFRYSDCQCNFPISVIHLMQKHLDVHNAGRFIFLINW